MNELLQKTDIVVRGIVGNPKSYLSDDERNVYTDYVIVNPVFLYQPQLVPSARPGIVPSVTVTQLGGSITLPNGLTFTQTEQGLLLLEPGTEGLFLLQRVGDQHRLVGTFYGAFRIEAGTLTPLAKRQSFAPEYRGVPATEAEASMVARLQSLRK
jgi:hypothetical protein